LTPGVGRDRLGAVERICTIGVYGADLDSFLATLAAAKVDLVLDVRQRRVRLIGILLRNRVPLPVCAFALTVGGDFDRVEVLPGNPVALKPIFERHSAVPPACRVS